MRRLALVSCVLAATVAAACSRQPTAKCEPSARYATARSAPPVQIPDDLSPPSESDALRLPPDVAPNRAPQSQECLETPPAFSDNVRLGRRSAEQAETPEPAPSTEPAADGDRAIDN